MRHRIPGHTGRSGDELIQTIVNPEPLLGSGKPEQIDERERVSAARERQRAVEISPYDRRLKCGC